MHRQSLGSPASKHLNAHGVIVGGRDDGSPAALPATESSHSICDEGEGRKSLKRVSKAEKYVHLIPLLTVFCFLVLYLSSHRPTENDLAQFNGFKPFLKPKGAIEAESGGIADLHGVLEIEKGDVLAIRSLRNLREIDGRMSSKHRFHRKIANF
ncbi:unnamed protein product [Cuscuta epithymum]|uniref:Uncharacterized protein n=1 Tax=Cuscuta epithymum TaxID=186058 RepID=A0AAV0FC97_9ASTE|nr:unnamed protein product [Cuscuta epithymum]